MLPFETPTIFEQLPRFIFQMPRVVTDQKSKFENEELFRKLSRETEIRYTAYRDRPIEERQIRFINGCREGHTDVSFTATGTNLQLVFNPCVGAAYFTATDHCDFEKEKGKVHIRSSMIFDGVCIRWRGWIDLERLDGIGCLEYDEDRGRIEEAVLKEQIEQYKMRMREFEERQRLFKLAQAEHQKKLPPQTTTPTSQLTPPINGLMGAPQHHHHHSMKQASSPAGKTELRKHHIENILNASGAPELTTGASKKH